MIYLPRQREAFRSERNLFMSEAGLPLEIERKFLIALPDAALLEEKRA